jgi:hypothetical protein
VGRRLLRHDNAVTFDRLHEILALEYKATSHAVIAIVADLVRM